MKAPLSQKVISILRNRKDARVFAKAVRDKLRTDGEMEVTLPSGRKVRVKQVRVVDR